MAWIPFALAWVVCVFVADATRVECVSGSEDCGSANACVASTCVCPEPTWMTPRAYRCGDNLDFVVNVADVVGICFGVVALVVLGITMCVGRGKRIGRGTTKRDEDEEEEEEEVDGAMQTCDVLVTSVALILTVVGVVLICVSVWVIDPASAAKPAVSTVALVSFVCAVLTFLYCTPQKRHK